MQYSELEKILLAYPNKKWNFKDLSMNPNISLNFIINNPQFKWNYKSLCEHPLLTIEFIKKNKLNKSNLAMNLYLSPEYLISINDDLDDLEDLVDILHDNKLLSVEFIKNNLHLDWNWGNLVYNPAITVSDIKNNPDLPWRVGHYIDPDGGYHSHDEDGAYPLKEFVYPEIIDYKIKLNNKLKKEKLDIIHKKIPDNLESTTIIWDGKTININTEHNGNLTFDIIQNNPQYKWDFRQISINQFNYKYKLYSINIIKKWYKKMKLVKKLWLVIEVMVIEQMKPDGKYMQQYIKNLD